jgi:glyoxylase-like metal-dependent hydrolase (beta-lactamase superfamily II)
VSTLSTIVIDPPDGDMRTYLRSLERVRALEPLRGLYPAHGGPLPSAGPAIDGYLAHRHERAGKVAAALPGTLAEVTARAYDDTPLELHPLAARSCLATLHMLVAEGRAVTDGERWRAR